MHLQYFISLQTVFLQLHTGKDHTEKIQLDVIHTPTVDVILGMPWLQLHNPRVDWTGSQQFQWSPYVLKNCCIPSLKLCRI
ncbi:hypothetical protein FKM82_030810 [Ascaphus truei]